MKFSLSLPLLKDLSARDPYRETFELARIAEESGFDTATIGHHHFMVGNLADPLTFLAAVAARTSTLRVGTGIFQLPIHHPVRVAEQVATIDQISGGRISLGVGLGWWPLEYEVHGSDYKERGARMDEIIDKLARAQQADGYLNSYYTVKEPGRRWTNLRDNHELYCAGHMIEAAVAQTAFSLAMPVSKSDAAQPAQLVMKIVDLKISDALWNMVDPGSQLPRDPATLVIDLSGAIRCTEQLLARNPRSDKAFDKLFRRVRERKDNDRLLSLIERRLEVADDEQEIAKLFWERARVLQARGDQDGALSALENVTMLEPDHVGALALSGTICIQKGDFAGADRARGHPR